MVTFNEEKFDKDFSPTYIKIRSKESAVINSITSYFWKAAKTEPTPGLELSIKKNLTNGKIGKT